jgi:hypothetical protein
LPTGAPGPISFPPKRPSPAAPLSYRTVTDLGGSDYYLSNNANRATIARADAPNNPDTSTWRSATLAEFIAWNAGDFAPNVSAADVHGNNARVLVGRRDYLSPMAARPQALYGGFRERRRAARALL